MAIDPNPAEVIGLVAREHDVSRCSMHIRVLGPLEASIDDQPVSIGGAKQRAVLAMLVLEANHTVTGDRLIDGLWGDDPPASAPKMVQHYVWRLRGALPSGGGAEILTRGRAYELRIDRDKVDVCRFERLVLEASRAATAGRPTSAAREALALFRGDPLADLAEQPFADPEIRRLEELRLAATELAIDADLAAGRHHELVGELDALVAENPLRERLHAQRMLALYRCGRQAEALEAYRHARTALVEEIGVEPSAELRHLHEAILRQDPSLDVEAVAGDLPHELDANSSPPLIGREDELRRLRACWQRTAGGSGALITLVGTYGMGKTRLAAELAGDAHREGAAVLYTPGTGPPEAALAILARARGTRRPSLIVVDDVDRAPAEVRAALRRLVPALDRVPALVLATGTQAAALARLEPRDSIVLEPLDADGVRAIAGIYAPPDEGPAIPVEALMASSQGVARRVHEAASDWARREATRRVDAVADRAAAGRNEARALEAELAGSVVALQSARERAGLVAGSGDDDSVPIVCPYKGLATFDADDAEYFFGRERLVAELVARLVGSPMLAIVGPSGSGKSSVMRAGLLPALAGGVVPGSENWTQAIIRPGEQPLLELRRATRRLAREWRGVLAVDQFEEIFTACRDDAERTQFADALVRSARSGTVVILAVRADFYGRCAAYPGLSQLLGANHVLVGPMSRDELGRAIERPAQRVGLIVEPELVESLLGDVEGRPGALPLLSTALLELWRERDGRRLRHAAYARGGGVQGAVARLAEEAFVGLDDDRQAIARKLLVRLADEDESGAVVRRRVALADLGTGRGDELTDVVERLVDRRLLTVSDGAVEVAHEALLREWPRLREWLADDAEGRREHRRLSDAARAWDADARDPGSLYRGARLAAALDWAAGRDGDLSPTERAFLDDSRNASEHAQRRLHMMLAGVATLLVIAVIAGVVALDQRGDARAEATAADAQRLGAQALADANLDRGLLLARQGVALDDSVQARGNLFATLLKNPAAIGVLGGDGDPLASLDLSPDGQTLAHLDNDGTLSFVDTRTRRPTGPSQTLPGFLYGPSGGDTVSFSDDGSLLAIGGSMPVILDVSSRRSVASLNPSREPRFVSGVQFSADGREIVATIDSDSPGSPVTIRRFGARDGRPIGAPRAVGRPGTMVTTMVARGGARVVTTVDGGPTVIRDGRTLRPLRSLPGGGVATALSADGRTMVAGGPDGTVRFIDLATGSARRGLGRHDGTVVRTALSRDGRTAVTAGEDNRMIVWDVRRAAIRETLQSAARLTGLATAPDSRTLYAGGADGKVVIWDLAGDRRLGRVFGVRPAEQPDPSFSPFVIHALSPDGRLLAVGRPDGTVTLTDARTLRALRTFRGVPRGPVFGLAFMPDGQSLAVAGGRGYLALVDPRRGTVIERLRGHGDSAVHAPTFSADGRLMLTVSGSTSPSVSATIQLWRLQAGRPTGVLRRRAVAPVMDAAALSPDGRTIALTGQRGVEIIDTATMRRRATLPGSETVRTLLRYTPDGRYVVGGSYKGWTRLWSTRTWKPASPLLAGHTGEVLAASTSPDGRILATGGIDGAVRLYDLRTHQEIGAPLPAVPNRAVAPRFTPDGAYLFALTNVGRDYRWDVRPASWERLACSIAGRTLTRAEWNDALPGRDYRPACAA
jgi:DNA-binding SARP family transcriptional activator/WD40 repeat protein